MPRNRFIDPTLTTRLELSDGDWLEVKEGINWGDELRLLGLSAAAQQEGGSLGLASQWDRYKLEDVSAWVVDWSFTDKAGAKVPFSKEALAEVDPDTGNEILEALEKHSEAQRALPKATSGAKPSEAASS